MDPPISICQAFAAYRKRKEDDPKNAWSDAGASLGKSRECGCEYCSLACAMGGKRDDVERNKERNRATVLQNSSLNLIQPGNPEKKEDDTLTGEFKRSGLSVKGDDLSRELFVVERKTTQYRR
jgi:hypothetical protein